MPNQTAFSLESMRDIKLIDNGDGSFSIGVASSGGGGGASQVEGKQASGDPVTANPVLSGYMSSGGILYPIEDAWNAGGPFVTAAGIRNEGQAAPRPVVIGYKDQAGNVKTWKDTLNFGAPSVVVADGSLYISGSIRAAGTFDTTQADVTTSSALLFSGGPTTTRITIQNLDATNPIYIKNVAVSTTTGHRIAAGQSLTFEADMVSSVSSQIYAIATGGTVRVSILRQLVP